MERNKEENLIFDALSRTETPNYPIAAAVGQARARRHIPIRFHSARWVAAVTCVCLALAVTAGAVAVISVSDGWSRLFGEGAVPTAQVYPIGSAVTADGYTLTAQDAIVDADGMIVMATLTRDDGEAIDPKLLCGGVGGGASIQVPTKGKPIGFSSGTIGNIGSPDEKTRYMGFEFTSGGMKESLEGKRITLTVPYFSTWRTQVATVPMPPVGEVPSILGGENNDQIPGVVVGSVLTAALVEQGINTLSPLTEFSATTFQGAVNIDGGLRLITGTESAAACAGHYDARLSAVTDTRTGTRYDVTEGDGYSDKATGMDYFAWDCSMVPLDAQPYLDLEFTYDIDDIVAQGPFVLQFTVNEGLTVEQPLGLEMSVKNTDLHLTKLHATPRLVTFDFSDAMDTAHALYGTDITPVITLTDGTRVSTRWNGGRGGGERCSIAYQPVDTTGERAFLDVGKIRSIAFGENEIAIVP